MVIDRIPRREKKGRGMRVCLRGSVESIRAPNTIRLINRGSLSWNTCSIVSVPKSSVQVCESAPWRARMGRTLFDRNVQSSADPSFGGSRTFVVHCHKNSTRRLPCKLRMTYARFNLAIDSHPAEFVITMRQHRNQVLFFYKTGGGANMRLF